MTQLKIAILGARGIGKYHAREFSRAGADVVAILGSSKETAEGTASDLSGLYNIHPRAYFELDKLIENEQLDAVSVCTPPQLHYGQVKKCLGSGLHVMCEKPLVLNSDCQNSPLAAELVGLAKKEKLILCVNTQWPSVLEYFKPFVNLSTVQDFFMFMQPSSTGREMLFEQLSHMNSVLVKLLPNGKAENIEFSTHEPNAEEISVRFKYLSKGSNCDVHYHFKHKPDRPRDVQFSINGVDFKRSLGELYKQKFITTKAEIDVGDPLATSIKKFVDAIVGTSFPLVSTTEILENVVLQDRIISAYPK